MDKPIEIIEELDNTEIAYSFECKTKDLWHNLQKNVSDLSIVTQNIRSIYRNFDDFQISLAEILFEVDVIVLTECRLNASKPIPSLTNYNSFTTTNHLNQCDGVTTYVKNNHDSCVVEIKLEQASCLQIKVYNMIILCIYRSPSITNADNFINSLITHLETIKSFEKIIIVGDININILSKTNERSNERINRLNYLNALSMHGLLPGHYLPTRENSCLDHYIIKLNKAKNSAAIAVLHTSTTDHRMLLLNISKVSSLTSTRKNKTIIDYEKAIQDLNVNLIDLLQLNDPNILTKVLINKIQKSLKDNTQLVYISRSKRILKPWITHGILRCIRNRNNMQLKLRYNPNDAVLKITFRRYRNFCNNLIKKLKRKYERDQLTKTAQNSKALWNTINNITHYKAAKTPNIQLLNIEHTPIQSVNHVNRYFASIGQTLAEKILQQNCTHTNFDTHVASSVNQTSSFVLLEADQNDVLNVILSLKSKSAPGWDNISTTFLKLAKPILIPVICHLVNLCFNTGTFPNLLKQSIITPVFKSGDGDDVNNYRPISVLPSISKILEKLINNRLLNYLNKYDLISKSQFGFRQGLSTEDAVTELSATVAKEVDKGRKCITVFLDFKKAFDTVSIPILLQKLERHGIRGPPLALLADYLLDRKQRVRIGEVVSEDVSVTYGVPQGSVLGPTLFLLYINDLCNMTIEDGHIFSYADDTAIVFSGHSWTDVKNKAEKGLVMVNEWLKNNLLSLNIAKTNYICFTMYNRTQPDSMFNITIHKCNLSSQTCGCSTINKVDSTKYLGIIIDQRLSWHAHLEQLMSRTRKLMWIFKNLRNVASHTLLKQIYVALAQSILNYCIPVWGGATKTHFLGLERAQRSLLKVMYFKPYRYPTDTLYSELDILSVRKLYILNSVLKLHKSVQYDPSKLIKRRKYSVIKLTLVNSTYAIRQYLRQSAQLYNKINKLINIYPMNNRNCKMKITDWLLSLSYDDVEALLLSIT